MLGPHIFTCTIDSRRLASAHPNWGGGPPKNLNRENLKFALKFSVLDEITSGLVGVFSRDFFQSTYREAGVIIWAQFLQRPPPKICHGKKIVKNSARFLTSFDFDREYLRNGSTYQKSETLSKIYNHSHVGGKKVCVLRSTNDRVYSPNKFTP